MTDIIKVDDNTVAKVGTREIRQIFGRAQLLERKLALEQQLQEVVDMLALLP